MGYFLDNILRNGSLIFHDTRKRSKKKNEFTIFDIYEASRELIKFVSSALGRMIRITTILRQDRVY